VLSPAPPKPAALPAPLAPSAPSAPSTRKSYILQAELTAELMAALDRLEGVLVQIATWEDADDLVLSPPLAADRALHAVRRLWDTLAAAQGGPAVFVEVDDADLRTIAGAVAQLRYAATRPAASCDELGNALATATNGADTAATIAADNARLLAQATSLPDPAPLR
jgi:hypothetical protein